MAGVRGIGGVKGVGSAGVSGISGVSEGPVGHLHFWRLLPHRRVVVERHCEMVRDQILTRDAHVHRVPERELAAEGTHHIRWDTSGVLTPQEDVIPKVAVALLWRYVRRSAALPEHLAALEEVGDGVVGHVDGRVGEGLDEELRRRSGVRGRGRWRLVLVGGLVHEGLGTARKNRSETERERGRHGFVTCGVCQV